MPLPSSRTCRACNATIEGRDDIYVGWCKSCQRYDYEIYDTRNPAKLAPPIALDTIVADIQRELRFRPSMESMVELGFEPMRDTNDTMCWRAFVKVNGRVAEYSRRAQLSPQDALHELWHLCRGVKPEDI